MEEENNCIFVYDQIDLPLKCQYIFTRKKKKKKKCKMEVPSVFVTGMPLEPEHSGY